MSKKYGKLVRDKIPDIIRAQGETPHIRTLSDAEYLDELIEKLGEEYEEFKADRSVEELADIQEVVLALADALSGKDSLESTRRMKADERGTFEKRIFLIGKS